MSTIEDALARLHRIGGEKLVRKMVAAFLQNAEKRIETAGEALSAGDHDALERAAHSLKSSAGNVGAAELARLAAEVEHLAAAGGEPADAHRLEDLVGRLSGVLHDVGKQLESEHPG